MAAVAGRAQAVKAYPRIETGAHAGIVYGIDVDAAERLLVSASVDKTARVWDLQSGTLLKILRPPIGPEIQGSLYSVAVSPDGRTVAVGGFTGPRGSRNNPIFIFDRESGELRKVTRGLPDAAQHLAYSKDGRYLAAGMVGAYGIRVFETAGYSEVARDEEYDDTCIWLEFDNSGRLATASYDGFVRLYSFALGSNSKSDLRLPLKEKLPHGKQPRSARFSPDGNLIAVGFLDSMAVDVISGSDLSHQYELETPAARQNLGTALWSADGRTLCATGTYGPDSVFPVLCWGDRGQGSRSVFPAANDCVIDIRALRDGAIAFGSVQGSVGVLGRGGSIQWQSLPDLADLRGGPSLPPLPRLSPEGDTVEAVSWQLGSDRKWNRHDIGFSVSGQRLDIDAPTNPPLPGPSTSGLAVDKQDVEHPTLDGRALALDPHERAESLAIAPDKGGLVLGTNWNLRRFDRQGPQVWQTYLPGTAWGTNVSADGRFVVAVLSDGTIRWYTFEDGKEVLALFVHRDLRRWVAWNPDGFFSFEGDADGLIGWQIDRGPGREGDFIRANQLRDVFLRRELIAQILGPGGAAAVAAASSRIGDLSGILSGGAPPEIELISPAEANVTGEYLLQFRVKDMGGGIGRIVYRIDGREMDVRDAFDIRGTASDVNSRYIDTAVGKHKVEVSAYDAKNRMEGLPKTAWPTRSLPAAGPRPNLHVVAAGVTHYSAFSGYDDVKFAAADADMVAARFEEQEGKGLYRKVNAVSLPDGRATADNIRTEVARAAKTATADDTFVLYLAGHGVAVDGEYHFIPWVTKPASRRDLLDSSLNREKIQALLRQVPTSKSVLILDTCSAGAYLEATPIAEKAAIRKIASMSRRAVLAASRSGRWALSGYQNHGVFTYALLEGLELADSTPQGDIPITLLGDYLKKRVPVLSQERWNYIQTPVVDVDEPFPIVRKAVY
jgi:WD40 repeat protein